MSRFALALLAASLALAAAPALAQQQASKIALPMEAVPPLHGPVPGLGGTPGEVILYIHPGAECAANAQSASDTLITPSDAIDSCNRAITSGVVPEADLPGVFVNRGVLLMMLKRAEDAKRDFNKALELDPNQAEALANRGMLLIGEGKPAEGVADLDRAIALGPGQLAGAYLNRGRGREDLKDIKGAYADYSMAAQLKPDWPPVMAELSRFTVRRR